MASPLRCHLLIGPPGSGKSTMAELLAGLVQKLGQTVEVLSTDSVRRELYGDASIKGQWSEIEATLQQRLFAAVEADRAVILDATHIRRAWRLAVVQALFLSQPVEWIGWWLQTPLATCQDWNRQRERHVDPEVVASYFQALQTKAFQPSRQEGFAAVVTLDPSTSAGPDALNSIVGLQLAALDRRIGAARNKEPRQPHGYARLLDFERLTYLIRLLLRFPGLDAPDAATRDQLEAIASPLPEDDLAERAAALLRAEVGACYADVSALRLDLAWLEEQGFKSRLPCREPITPPLPNAATLDHRGGWPPEADPAIFCRVMTLLRNLIQLPFDSGEEALRDYLAGTLATIPGGYSARDGDNLRKDVERILTPYGFRPRHDAPRQGYALGTAVLSAPQLQELVQLLDGVVQQLSDPTKQDLLLDLKERLRMGGLEVEKAPPLRRIANRSIISTDLVRSDSLALEGQAKRLEIAILARQRVQLDRYGSAARFEASPTGLRWVWPLQLVFHTIGWYVAYEEEAIGGSGNDALIRLERLDRLALRHVDTHTTQEPVRRQRSLQRLDRLLHASGGIFFGDDLAAQLAVAGTNQEERRRHLQTLRFRCNPLVFSFLREGLQRFPLEATRLSRPLPADRWWRHPKAPHTLAPLHGNSHPYPIEIDLPVWTLASDVDLRRWLFGFGDGLIVESPEALRQEHQDRGRKVMALYA
jgi:predicted kinase